MNDSKSSTKFDSEFREIGHCGGQFTVKTKTTPDGQRSIQFGVTSSRPVPAAWFGIYALPDGIPVGTIELGGIGQPWNPRPTQDSISVFIGSDSQGMFGHQCRSCDGYWRSKSAPARWRTTCPYCGIRQMAHEFVTDGQLQYVRSFCDLVVEAANSDEDGERAIDMDAVADATNESNPKPAFYYSEESQQNRYECDRCGDTNDILGRYGYCSCCGVHNGLQELDVELEKIRERIDAGAPFEGCVKDAVATFDSFARQIGKKLVESIPMTLKRQREWNRKLFHNLRPRADELKSVFDIDLLNGLKQDEIAFGELMFHRRHVYEHNGGEADAKYITDSGDTTVRPKQMLREDKDTASRTLDFVRKIAANLSEGFESIFPHEEGVPMKRKSKSSEM